MMPPSPTLAICSVFAGNRTAPVGTATPGLNYTRFNNAQLNNICRQLSLGAATKRQALFQQAQTILAEQAPVAIMYNIGGHVVYRTDRWTGWDPHYPVSSVFSIIHVHAPARS
jgi:peptide/nickel transport system substrate-binding protein